jgi:translation initiation factor 2B subunit (eIF-2B alpha/beta/delta family)
MPSFSEQIEMILQDHTSGSTAILHKTQQVLKSVLPGLKNESLEDIVKQLNRLFFKHSGFAVLYHFINEFFLEMEKGKNPKDLHVFLNNYIEEWKDVTGQCVLQFMHHIDLEGKTLLLHSNSSAIHHLVHKIQQEGLHVKVVQTLSGPAEEGKVQAEQIAACGIGVDLIHDTAISKFLNQVDLAIVGADALFEDFFINKSGTFGISLLMKEVAKPVYVISDSRKLVDKNQLPREVLNHLLQEQEKPTEELWESPPERVTVRNFWFEAIPLRLIAGLAIESGWIENLPEGMNMTSRPGSGLFKNEIE